MYTFHDGKILFKVKYVAVIENQSRFVHISRYVIRTTLGMIQECSDDPANSTGMIPCNTGGVI